MEPNELMDAREAIELQLRILNGLLIQRRVQRAFKLMMEYIAFLDL